MVDYRLIGGIMPLTIIVWLSAVVPSLCRSPSPYGGRPSWWSKTMATWRGSTFGVGGPHHGGAPKWRRTGIRVYQWISIIPSYIHDSRNDDHLNRCIQMQVENHLPVWHSKAKTGDSVSRWHDTWILPWSNDEQVDDPAPNCPETATRIHNLYFGFGSSWNTTGAWQFQIDIAFCIGKRACPCLVHLCIVVFPNNHGPNLRFPSANHRTPLVIGVKCGFLKT